MKHKVRVKKRVKKRKKKISGLVKYSGFILVFVASLWLFYEVTKPQVAKEWVDIRVKQNQNIRLPEDDGYHANRMEWWYYNGHLLSASGQHYSFHFVTFLVNDLMTHTVVHSSLGDHSQNQYYIDQSRTGGNPSVGVKNSFNFSFPRGLMQGRDGYDKLQVENDQYAFNLQLESTQPVIQHGEDGIISLGIAGASYYYSRPRMKITGTLKVAGVEESVTGVAWFDHQWGDFVSVKLAWDWFSLQLDNGVDLMVYQLRDKQGTPVLYSASVFEKGTTEILAQDEFSLTPGTRWVSDKTSDSYPVSWNLKIPGKKIDLNIKSIIDDSEFDARLTTLFTYWEGAVSVKGSHTGQGFMELNGYGPETD